MPEPNYRSMGKFGELVEKLNLSTELLKSPGTQGEALAQDLDPRNFDLIDKEIQRARSPAQREILMGERTRLENLHRRAMEEASASGRFSVPEQVFSPAEGGRAPEGAFYGPAGIPQRWRKPPLEGGGGAYFESAPKTWQQLGQNFVESNIPSESDTEEEQIRKILGLIGPSALGVVKPKGGAWGMMSPYRLSGMLDQPMLITEFGAEMLRQKIPERLLGPAYYQALQNLERYARTKNRSGLDISTLGLGHTRESYSKINQWAEAAARNYLNKSLGTAEDPLRDVRLRHTYAREDEPPEYRWETLTDALVKGIPDPKYPGQTIWSFAGADLPSSKSTTQKEIEKLLPILRSGLDELVTPYVFSKEFRDFPTQLAKYDAPRLIKEASEFRSSLELAKQKAAQELADKKTVLKLPNDYRWIKLDEPGMFKAEGDAMGHSVGGYEPGHTYGVDAAGYESIKNGRAQIYSLRDAKGSPHATIEIEAGSRSRDPDLAGRLIIRQVKGKRNQPETLEKYKDDILEFLNNLSRSSGDSVFDGSRDLRALGIKRAADIPAEAYNLGIPDAFTNRHLAEFPFNDKYWFTIEEFNRRLKKLTRTFAKEVGSEGPY